MPAERMSSLKDGGPWIEDQYHLQEADAAIERIAFEEEYHCESPSTRDIAEVNERYDMCLSLGWSFKKLSARLSIIESDARRSAKNFGGFW